MDIERMRYSEYEYMNISSLVGKTLKQAYQEDGDQLHLITESEHIVMCHMQDCCESVSLDDICGDLSDLVGSPIFVAEEVTGETPSDFDPENFDSHTWTFYKIDTAKGGVTLRWFGTSNGYYSEGVDMIKIIKEAE